MDGWLFGLMAIDIGPINYYIHDYKSEVSRKGRGGGVPANFFTIEKRIPTNLCSMREREMKKKNGSNIELSSSAMFADWVLRLPI